MTTMRAMRRLRPDPVPDALIRELIEAAMYAPSAGHQQGQVFVVVTDRDRIARLAERKDDAVVQALLDEIEPAGDRAMADWPDLLANELRAGMKTPISVWAKKHGLTRESVSRGSHRVYGVSPVRFRAAVRARAAWYMLVSTRNPLSVLSLQSGFCDQSHMTRAVHRMTGRSPGEWRRINWFKTAHPHTD